MATDEELMAEIDGLFAQDLETAGTENFVQPALPRSRVKDLANFNPTESGADLLDRLAMGFKFNKTGAVNYLRSIYGQSEDGSENVLPVTDSLGNVEQILVRNPKDGIFRPVDPDVEGTGFSDILGDIMDLGGDVVEAGFGLAGSVAGAAAGAAGGLPAAGVGSIPGMLAGATAGGAAGDAAGSVVRQTIGAMLPGEEDASLLARGGNVAFNVGSGLLGEAAQGGAKIALRKGAQMFPKLARTSRVNQFGETLAGKGRDVSPSSVTGSATFEKAVKDTEALEKRVNLKLRGSGEEILFTPGQASGSRRMLSQERTFAQTPEFVDNFAVAHQQQVSAFGELADRTVNAVAADPKQLGKANVGRQIATSLRGYMETLRIARSDAARPLFEEVDRISKGRVSIDLPHARGYLSQQLAKYRGAATPISNALKSDLEALGKGKVTASTLQDFMAEWGERLADPRKFEGVIPGADANTAKRMVDMLKRDLDLAIKSRHPAARKLLEARTAWAQGSEAIDSAAPEMVRRLLKLDVDAKPDKIVGALKNLGDVERTILMESVEKSSKETAKNVRGQFLAEMLDEAGGTGGKILDEDVILEGLSPAKLNTLFRKNKKAIRTIYGTDMAARKELSDLTSVSGRLAQHPGFAGSDTMPKILEAFSNRFGSMAGMVKEVVSTGIANKDAIAEMLSTREGMKRLRGAMEIAMAPPHIAKKRAGEAADFLMQLTAIHARDVAFNRELEDFDPVDLDDSGNIINKRDRPRGRVGGRQ